MRLYGELSSMWQIIFGICALLVLLGAVSLLTAACVMRLKWKELSAFFVATTGALLLLQAILETRAYRIGKIQKRYFGAVLTAKLPWLLVALILVFVAGVEIILFVRIRRKKEKMLLPGAVKESLDALPDGVCFFSPDGQPLLANTQMNKISSELFGTPILNANHFRKYVWGNRCEKSSEDPDHPLPVVLYTDDGKVWDMHWHVLEGTHQRISELLAFDVTRQHMLQKKLKQRNARLKRVNMRLKRFRGEMVEITLKKELLDAEIRVHDDVGRSLLAFRSYMAQTPEKRDREQLLGLWRHTFLRSETGDFLLTSWDELKKTADSLQISMELTGQLPEEEKWKKILLAAAHETLTNTARHAEGDRLYIYITETKNVLTAEYTNSGKKPEHEIRETGGLANLRRMVEAAGGSMTVESSPRFLLRITFTGGERNDG